MPKLPVDDSHFSELSHHLKQAGLDHLRVTKRGDLLTIVSGVPGDEVKHARLRRVTVQYFELEIADHRGRFEPTMVRGIIPEVVAVLLGDFGWTLTPIDNPRGT